jgi:hypothetical protein
MTNISSDVLGFFLAILQIRVGSLLEEHNNKLVIDLRGDISLVAKTLDELLDGLSLLLDDAG